MYKIITGPRGGKYYIKDGKKYYLRYTKEDIDSSQFCGPAGGYPMGTFPVDTKKRCIAVLSYARFAPDPCGIARCVKDKCPTVGKYSKLINSCK